MPDPVLRVNIAEWVERAKPDPVTCQQRQTVEIPLNAIAMAASLQARMCVVLGQLETDSKTNEIAVFYDLARQLPCGAGGDRRCNAYLAEDGAVLA